MMVDGFAGWSCSAALISTLPEQSSLFTRSVHPRGDGSVSHTDEEANAAFFYFPMKARHTPPGIDTPDFKYSHSITPVARFGFDDEGGLLWVRFQPEEANASIPDFVSLIEARIEDTESG